MVSIIAIALLFFLLVMLIVMTYRFHHMMKANDDHAQKIEPHKEKISGFQNYIYAIILLIIVAILVCIYELVKGTPWESHLMEWLNIVVRVMHITFGIAWIGASFYFVFLENALNRKENVRDELAGNLWAIHGGGFYYLEKYKTAPGKLPKHLHWFKYEAYFTWLSGFSLLFVVYYFNAQAFLIDKNVRDLSPPAAIAIGIGSFVAAYVIYHFLCKTPLARKGILFAVIGSII